METCHFTIAAQALGKLQIGMAVPYYKLENVQRYLLNKREKHGVNWRLISRPTLFISEAASINCCHSRKASY